MNAALLVLLVIFTFVVSIAAQHFAFKAGQRQAHADWCGWVADGWKVYRDSRDVITAFGTRPTPWDRDQ